MNEETRAYLEKSIGAVALVKNTFSDYPGIISCALFLRGCNLRCPYCQNAALVTGDDDGLIPWSEAALFVERRAGLLKGVALSGGEAALNPALPKLIAYLKELGYLVKLDLNGSLPEKTAQFAPMVDYVAMDIKTRAHLALTGVDANTRRQSLEILNKNTVPFEVRSVISPHFCGEEELLDALPMVRSSRASLWRLLPFRPGGCLVPEYNDLPPSDSLFNERMAETLRSEGVNVVLG